MMIALPVMTFYSWTQMNSTKIPTSPFKEILLVQFFHQKRLLLKETRIQWEIIKSSQPGRKRIMSLPSKTFWKTMKLTMTRLLVLYLTVLILSLDGQLKFQSHGNYFLVKQFMGQVHPQKLTAKINKVHLDVIKNLLIMLARVRPNLTNIWQAYYVYLAQLSITKVPMSQLVLKKLWPDTIGHNGKKAWRLSITR